MLLEPGFSSFRQIFRRTRGFVAVAAVHMCLDVWVSLPAPIADERPYVGQHLLYVF